LGKTRVIHIITRLDKGGSAETTLQVVSLLNRERYEVFLFHGLSLESKMGVAEQEVLARDLSLVEKRGVRVFSIASLIRRLSLKNDLLAFISIYRLIKRIKPHIVHTHTSKAGVLGRLAAYLARVPVIIHTPHGHIFHSYYGCIVTKMIVFVERSISLVTDKITALTDRERDEHLEHGIASIDKYIIIHSGVMLQQIMNMNKNVETGKKKFDIPLNSNVIGVIGRLVPIKGHKYLVSAAKMIIKEFENTVFMFVGDGYLESKLERQAESLGVRNNIIFTGWRSDVINVLGLFDILVLPSLNEGMGKVLIEGMALGKPIVASSVGGIIDLVKNGDNGILVPPRDSDALAEAILKLVRSKNLAQRLGENGKSKVYPEYDTSTMIRQIEGLYERLLNGHFSLHTPSSTSGGEPQDTKKYY
jgi:glycosyltransferase involved in cell wall biosynthesis